MNLAGGSTTTKSGTGLHSSSFAHKNSAALVTDQRSRASIEQEQNYGGAIDKRQRSYNLPEKIKITTAQPVSRRRLQSQIQRNEERSIMQPSGPEANSSNQHNHHQHYMMNMKQDSVDSTVTTEQEFPYVDGGHSARN